MSLWDRLWRRSPAAPPRPPAPPNGAVANAARDAVLATAINPALGWLSLRAVPADDTARLILLAITGQEADARFRRQHGNGPARGLWQFERGGGVAGVLGHRASIGLAGALCAWRGVLAGSTEVHAALEHDDVLAAGFARLLLWTDPKPLPADEEGAWALYLRTWRPGAYTRGSEAERARLRAKWGEQWRLAREVVQG